MNCIEVEIRVIIYGAVAVIFLIVGMGLDGYFGISEAKYLQIPIYGLIALILLEIGIDIRKVRIAAEPDKEKVQ